MMKCQHSYHSQSRISVIKDTISEQQPMNTDLMAWEWISGWHPDHCEPASTWKQCGVSAKRLVHSVWKLNHGDDWKVASVQTEMIPQLHKNTFWFHEKKCICIVPILCGLVPLQMHFHKTWGSSCAINAQTVRYIWRVPVPNTLIK